VPDEEDGTATEHTAKTAQPVAALPPVEIPRERRPRWTTLTLLAVVAGLAAVLLGGLAVVWPDETSSPPPATNPALEEAVALLAAPGSDRIPFAGSVGRLVLLVGQSGNAMLVLNGLGPAPEGKVYQAWVTPPKPGKTVSAGSFNGSEQFVSLTRRVARGAQVGVTLESETGVTLPSRAPRLVAVRPVSGGAKPN